jgi:hypothetical protein
MCISADMEKQFATVARDRKSSRRAAKLAEIERAARERMLDVYVITCSTILAAAMAMMLLAG